MKYFFPRKKDKEAEPKVPQMDLPTAIMQNKEAIETLEKRQAHLERRCADLTNDARQRISRKDTEGAKLALKRKQMLDNELVQLGNARLTLEQQINTLESQQTQQLAVKALSHGVQAQKALNASVNIQSIDKLMDDLQEQQDRQQEVAQVLSQNIPVMNEDDLLAELGRLEEEELEKQLADVASVPSAAILQPATAEAVVAPPTSIAAPHTSTSRPVTASETSKPSKAVSDEEQLRKLEAELA